MEVKEQKIEINLTQFEGISDEIAKQIFEAVIFPMLQQMTKQDIESAKLFSFSVMWLAMGQYAQFFPTNNAKKSINFVLEKAIETLKQQRGEVNSDGYSKGT